MAEKIAKKTTKKTIKNTGLTVPVLTVDGKEKGTITLPHEIFGEKINKPLIAQAVRVHLANVREGGAATKTRGMVEGSTRKIYKQKGTGRARHGSIRAHIFVGGGVVFGPVPHDFALDMPKKMKKKAMISALAYQHQEGNIVIVDGMNDVQKKTSAMAQLIEKVAGSSEVLMVLDKESLDLFRYIRNIQHVECIPAGNLSAYAVITHQKIVFTKDAIKQILV